MLWATYTQQLDPLADKALLVSAMILLSIRFKGGTPFDQLPLWFPVLVISRAWISCAFA